MPTLNLAIDARKAKLGAAEFNAAATSVQSKASAVKKAVAGIFVGFGAAMVVRDLTRVNAQFGTTMSTLRAVTGLTNKTSAAFAAMQSQARELGATTRWSANEAGEGMVFLARAGFEANEILAATPGVLDLATAGALGLAEAADYASNILTAFNLEAEQMGRVGDVMVNTANSANTSVQQLADAMVYAAPVAGSLGISVEEAAAAIGVLGDSGIQASMAGTSLRGIMMELVAPTGEAAGTLKDMGINLADVNISASGLISVFEQLADANLGAEEALKIFNVRQAAAALVISKNIEKFKQLTKANKDAEGTAEKAAAVMSDNLAGAFKQLRSTVEEAYLQIGEGGFSGSLRTAVDTATEALRIILGLSDGTGELGAKAQALINTFKALTVATSTFIALKLGLYVDGLIKGFKALRATVVATETTVAATNAAMSYLSGGTVAASAAVGGLTKAFTLLRAVFITTPIGAVTAALGAAVAAIALFGEKTETATEKTRRYTVSIGDLEDVTNRYTAAVDAYVKAVDRADNIHAISPDEIKATEDIQNALHDTTMELLELSRAGKDVMKLGAFKKLTGFMIEFDEDKLRDQYIRTFTKAISEASTAQELKSAAEEISKVFDIDPSKFTAGYAMAGGYAITKPLEQIRSELTAAMEVADLFGIGLGEALNYVNTESLATGKSIEYMKDKLVEAEDEQERLNELIAQKESIAAIDEIVDSVEKQQKQIGMTTLEIERMAAVEKAQQTAANLGLSGQLEQMSRVTAAYNRLIEATNELKAAEDKRRSEEQFGKLKADLDLEYQLMGKTDADKRKELFLRGLGEDLDQGQMAELEAKLDRNRMAQMAEDAARGISEAFGQGFEDVILGASSMEDALKGVFDQIIKDMLRMLVIKPLMDAMMGGIYGAFGGGGGGLGNLPGLTAKGNAFYQGNIIPFARGGLVNRPTIFPMANGTGLMGEAGPEAVMPLTRTTSGDLGVKVDGGVGKQVSVVNNFHITTQDANSFRRSRRQILRDMDAATRNI